MTQGRIGLARSLASARRVLLPSTMQEPAARDSSAKHEPDSAAVQPRPLDRVERWMQAVITHPAGVAAGIDSESAQAAIPLTSAEVERVIARSQALDSMERLGVYANAYYARLLECLRDVFPIVARTLGEELFDRFALGYLQKYPSQSYTLCELGARFAQFLDETRPIEPDAAAAEVGLSPDWPRFVVDLARLEWTVGEVYDGPGMENRRGLSAEDIAAIPADRSLAARLQLAPCVRLLAFRFPVNDFYTEMRAIDRADDDDDDAVEDDAVEDDLAIPPPAETYVALSRRNYVVRRYPLAKPQYELLAAVQSGAAMGTAIAAAAAACDLSDDELAAALHRWFADWTADQFFLSVALD